MIGQDPVDDLPVTEFMVLLVSLLDF